MENQPKPKVKKQNPINPTLQDKLYATWKIFWKAGYDYHHTGKQDSFYTTLLEDLGTMELDEFLNKYGN